MTRARYEHRRIPGGPRLAVATLADAECVALTIHVPAGSRDEHLFPPGTAHFVEHMAFKGTDRRSARELSYEVENLGGQINACTSEDQTVYDGRGEADLLPVLADVLADMVWNPTFPEAELELEREVIAEEITMYHETPSDHIGDLVSRALWEGHPLGHPISGTHESIALVGRAALAEFRDQHHFRDDLVISAAGPFGIDEVEAALRPHLPAEFRPARTAVPFDRGKARPGVVREERDSDQLQLAMAWHCCGRFSVQRHALRLLSMMLGEAASSRLFLELREERGLCYQIASDVTLFRETGAFEISAGLDPDARDEAVACIRRETRDLAEHGPKPGELDRAKRLMIAQSKLAFESTAAHATWAGECVLDFDRIPPPAEWRGKVLGVTDDQVRDAARELFATEPSTAEIC